MSFLQSVIDWIRDPSHWSGDDGIPTRTLQHVQISFEAVAVGALIALPIGIALGHYGRFGNLAINISNVGRAVPSFGILIIAFQIFGLGDVPVLIALIALAIPPMVTNSYVGLTEVDKDVRDAARGMGYREFAQLLHIELPLALPLVMAGVRTSAVQVIATATVAAFIGGGGLGRFIVDGYATQIYPAVFAGALAVAVLAVATELVLGAAERLLTPAGVRVERSRVPRRAVTVKAA